MNFKGSEEGPKKMGKIKKTRKMMVRVMMRMIKKKIILIKY